MTLRDFRSARRYLLSGLLICCFIPSAGAAGANPPNTLQKKVDDYIRPIAASQNFSGCALLAREGKPIFDRCYAMADYELGAKNSGSTRFHIASVSKAFTAAAILLLQQEGKLSTDDLLEKFIPAYPHGSEIRLHHLLTHTSGIPNVNDFPEYEAKSREHLSLEEVIALFKDKPLKFSPGAKYQYSNSNYNLLAYVIEKVSGQKYGEFLAARFFKPLKMEMTGDDQDPARIIPGRAHGYVPSGADGIANAPYLDWSIKTGNGSLYSTSHDLLKWDQALATGQVLNAATLDKMFARQKTPFSYGWIVHEQFGRVIQEINGRSPGFTATLARYPQDKVTVIVTSNSYSALSQTMADDLAAILLDKPYRPLLPVVAVQVPERKIQDFFGTYQFGDDFVFNPGLKVIIHQENRHLVMHSSDSEIYLIPTSENTFIDRLYGGRVTFVAGPEGKSSALKWNFGKDYVATRIAP